MTVQGSCYGCGLPLQATQPGVAGYVAADKTAPMVQHKHNKKILCKRCQELSNGCMIPAVEDFSSRQLPGKQILHTLKTVSACEVALYQACKCSAARLSMCYITKYRSSWQISLERQDLFCTYQLESVDSKVVSLLKSASLDSHCNSASSDTIPFNPVS